jgi:hypothetical protein
MIDWKLGQKNFNKNLQWQKDFAQHGLSWRVQDAKRAGLHPLAALGAAGAQFSPVYGDTGMGASPIAGIGMDRGRRANQTQHQKAMDDIELKMAETQLEGAKFKNLLLQRELNSNTQDPKPLPNVDGVFKGQGDAEQLVKPQITISQSPGTTAGQRAGSDMYKFDDGTVSRMPREQMGDLLENWLPGKVRLYKKELQKYRSFSADAYSNHDPKAISWMKQNRPKTKIPGHQYRWDVSEHEWSLEKIGKEGSQLFKQWKKRPRKVLRPKTNLGFGYPRWKQRNIRRARRFFKSMKGK